MKTYLIKIDEKSIKLNPEYKGISKSAIHFTSNQKIPLLEEGKDYSIITWFEKAGVVSYSGLITTIITTEHTDLWKITKGLKLEINIERSHIGTNPFLCGDKYSYEYKNKKVKCCHCKESFDYKDLREDEHTCGCEDCNCSGNYTRYNVCPYCWGENCCELEFESISKYKQ